MNLSYNPNTSWEIIQANPDRDWNWMNLSMNPNITWEIIQGNPDMPWSWSGLSQNPNIAWEIVRSNPDKPWEWYGLSVNTFTLEKQRFIRDRAAHAIQNWWLELRLNPYHPVGRRKLERDYEIYVEGCQKMNNHSH